MESRWEMPCRAQYSIREKMRGSRSGSPSPITLDVPAPAAGFPAPAARRLFRMSSLARLAGFPGAHIGQQRCTGPGFNAPSPGTRPSRLATSKKKPSQAFARFQARHGFFHRF